MPCDTSEWAAGGWLRGEDGSIHKGPLKDCRLGTRLALVLLPFHGRRLLLGTGSIEGLFKKNWREKVYYHHITLSPVC